jgi:hypothetical protein
MTRSQVPFLKKQFLAAFRKCGNITAAAEKAGLADRRQHYRWLKSDARYAAAFAEAEEEAVDALELEARRRAQIGWDEPVYHGGKPVGSIRRYSDSLLMFLLKAARPEKYRERHDHQHGVSESLADLIIESRHHAN